MPFPPWKNGPYSHGRVASSAAGAPESDFAEASGEFRVRVEICANEVAAKVRDARNKAKKTLIIPADPSTNETCCAQRKGRRKAACSGTAETGLAGHFFQLLGIHVEIGIDVVDVIVVFKGLEQADHLRCRLTVELRIRGGNHRDLGHHGLDSRLADRL